MLALVLAAVTVKGASPRETQTQSQSAAAKQSLPQHSLAAPCQQLSGVDRVAVPHAPDWTLAVRAAASQPDARSQLRRCPPDKESASAGQNYSTSWNITKSQRPVTGTLSVCPFGCLSVATRRPLGIFCDRD